MMAEKRKTYTAEFKREAVRLVTEHHYGVAEAARNLGINTNMLRRWKREFADHNNGAFPGKGRLSPEQEELHRLRAPAHHRPARGGGGCPRGTGEGDCGADPIQ
jgi:transposase